MDTVSHHAENGNTPLKRCPKCPEGQQWHPATTEFWNRNKSGKYGLDSRCRKCHSTRKPPLPNLAPEGYKRCRTCPEDDQWHPLTLDFWRRDATRKDGFSPRCKNCLCKTASRRHVTAQVIPEGYKRCSTCPPGQNVHPATTEFFHHNKHLKGGLCSSCKECLKRVRQLPEVREQTNGYRKEYHQRPEVRDRSNARQRERYQNLSPEKHRLRLDHNKEYRNRPEVHSQQMALQSRYYRLPENYERILKRTRAWEKGYRPKYYARPGVRERRLAQARKRAANPEYQEKMRARRKRPDIYAKMVVASRNRRALKNAVPGTHTASQITDQLKRQHYRCYYAACGFAKLERKNGKYVYHVEHTYPLSRVAGSGIPANDMSYLVLACPTCNLQKNDKFPWEFPEGGRLL